MKDHLVSDKLLNKKSLFWGPEYLGVSAWIEHIPFAFWIVETWQPKIIVELGVHNGISYFSFCQAVKHLNLNTSCFGVDSWTGDEHAGFYDESIFREVMAHNNKEYSKFSTLLKTTFDGANNYFNNESIDFLHIDGFHTYEAVKHDFETWFPKLSNNALVLFHDINVRERNFGVFKLWDELKKQYAHFQFDFGYGLGILVIGQSVPEEIKLLCDNNKANSYLIFLRNLFSERGGYFNFKYETELLKIKTEADFSSQQDSVTTLTNTNHSLYSVNDDLSQKIAGFSDAFEKESAINHQLQLNDKIVKDNYSTLSIVNDELKKEIVEIKLHNEELDIHNRQLQVINNTLLESNDITKLALSQLEGKLAQSELNSMKLKEDYDTIALDHTKAQGYINKLTLLNQLLNQELEKNQIKNNLLEENKKQSAKTNEQLSGVNQLLKLNISDLIASTRELKISNHRMEETILESEATKSQLLENYRKIATAYEKLLEKHKITENKITQFEHLVSDYSSKIIDADTSCNQLTSELAEARNTIKDLNNLIQQERRNIQWYKATYEDRSILGTLKEKLMALFKNKLSPEFDIKIAAAENLKNPDLASREHNETPAISNKLEKQKKRFSLRPANQIISAPGSRQYSSTGNDPFFIVESHDLLLKSGWYWLSIKISEIEGTIFSPKLYYSAGQGYNEENSWNLPFINKEKIERLIHFPFDIQELRFDPTTAASTFSIEEFDLNPMGKISVFQTGLSLYKNIYCSQKSGFSFCALLLKDFFKTGKPSLREKIRLGIYYEEKNAWKQYNSWYALYDTISPKQLEYIRRLSANLEWKPLFSIVMPVYNAPLEFLKSAIESVINQAYGNWELCIADDQSTNEGVEILLKEYQQKDNRIKVVFREINGHISNASNSALNVAQGDYITLLDQDDELPLHALYMVAEVLNKNKQLGIIYSDEDKMDENGIRFDPYFKTDWNKELFYGQNMISHLGVYKHSLIKKIGGFRVGYEGSQDYDLALRCLEHLTSDEVHHIPHILYHWRAIAGSTARTISNKDYAVKASRTALQDHINRLGLNATIEENIHNSLRVKWALPIAEPLVSIIIPTKDKLDVLSSCISSIFQNTAYTNFEILIIDNNSIEEATLSYFKKLQRDNKQVSVLVFDTEFNFSAINNFGVQQAKGEVIVMLNNDTTVINKEWLSELVSQALRKEIGAVGAKLFYPNGQIQHAGVFLHEGHPGNHIYLKRNKDDPGYFNKLNLVQNYIAVTAACLAVRKEVYLEVGGLDEQNLKVAYNDVDFCLKLAAKGYKNLWTPFAQLTHHESLSRGNDLDEKNYSRFKKEHSFVLNKWKTLISNDPFFNPNLGIDTETTQFAFPPGIRYEWQENY